MGREAKREEEDRKRKEEEARRKEHVKKWLRSKKVKREENKKNMLEVKSSREGGTILPVVPGPHQHPEIVIYNIKILTYIIHHPHRLFFKVYCAHS